MKKAAVEALVEAYYETALNERGCRVCSHGFKNGTFNVEEQELSGSTKLEEEAELEALF